VSLVIQIASLSVTLGDAEEDESSILELNSHATAAFHCRISAFSK